jgi:hypothetical protein
VLPLPHEAVHAAGLLDVRLQQWTAMRMPNEIPVPAAAGPDRRPARHTVITVDTLRCRRKQLACLVERGSPAVEHDTVDAAGDEFGSRIGSALV